MSYRDDLDAAHAKIAALEHQLVQASATTTTRFDSAIAAKIVFMKYLDAVVAGRDRDPLVVLVETELGDPEFHDQVRLFAGALQVEGKTFTLDTHQGLRNAIESLLAKAALLDKALR